MLVVTATFNKGNYRNREPKLRENIYYIYYLDHSRKPAQANLRDKSITPPITAG